MAIVLYKQGPLASAVNTFMGSFMPTMYDALQKAMQFNMWQKQQDYLQQLKQQERDQIARTLENLNFDISPTDTTVNQTSTFSLPDVALNLNTGYKSSQVTPPQPPPETTYTPTEFIDTPKTPSEFYSQLLLQNKTPLATAMAYGINLFPLIRDYADQATKDIQQQQLQQRAEILGNSLKQNYPFMSNDQIQFYQLSFLQDPLNTLKQIRADVVNYATAQGLAKRFNADAQDIYNALRSGFKVDDISKIYNNGYKIKDIGGMLVATDAYGNTITDENGQPKVLGYTPEHALAVQKEKFNEWAKQQELNLEKQKINSQSGGDDTNQTLKTIDGAINVILKKYKIPNEGISTVDVVKEIAKINPADAQKLQRLYDLRGAISDKMLGGNTGGLQQPQINQIQQNILQWLKQKQER